MANTIKSLSKITLLALSISLLSACQTDSASSTPPPPSAGSLTVVKPGVPGGITSSVIKVTAVVIDIDYKKRTVTLKNEQGEKLTLDISPTAVNFQNVKKGDHVVVEVAKELAIYLREKNAPKNDGSAGVVAQAAPGEKPAVLVANTTEMTAVVKAIDLKKHTATLQFADGSSKTVNVREDVVLNKHQIGREVVFRLTSAMAVTVKASK
ncbi:MAG TPA: hypothetical protein VLB90_07975 [Pseudomonadales bacterium]|nr:hypothetical protein [Pseudomonadales bacterium]